MDPQQLDIVRGNTDFGIPTFWTPEQQDGLQFLRKTDTQYVTMPLNQTLMDRGLDNRLLESLMAYLPKGAVISGGFMTSIMSDEKNASDIDIWFDGPESFKKAFDLLTAPPEDPEAWAWKEYKLDTDTKVNWGTLRYIRFVHPKRPPIQLLKLAWYEDAESVIDSFDLTVVQFAAHSGDSLTVNPIAFYDLAHKKLVLHRMQFPASTMRRIVKYAKKGFYACPGSLVHIADETQRAMNAGLPPDIDAYVYID